MHIPKNKNYLQYKLSLHLLKIRKHVLAHIRIIFSFENKNFIFSSLLKDIKSTVKRFPTLNTFSLKSL